MHLTAQHKSGARTLVWFRLWPAVLRLRCAKDTRHSWNVLVSSPWLLKEHQHPTIAVSSGEKCRLLSALSHRGPKPLCGSKPWAAVSNTEAFGLP